MVAWTVDRWQRYTRDVFNVKNKLMLFLCHNFIVKKCFISHHDAVTKSNQSHINNCNNPIVSRINDRMRCEIWPAGEEGRTGNTGTGRVASDERCCTMGIITGGTKEYAITNDHCGTNTIVQHTHLSDISGINLNFLISAP